MSETQNDRILNVLHDRLRHTTAAIHQQAGYSRLNSRISELRRRGHQIDCQRIQGACHGPNAYQYRLVAAPDEATATNELSPAAAVASSDADPADASVAGTRIQAASDLIQLVLV